MAQQLRLKRETHQVYTARVDDADLQELPRKGRARPQLAVTVAMAVPCKISGASPRPYHRY
jgi:hypothetical protein